MKTLSAYVNECFVNEGQHSVTFKHKGKEHSVVKQEETGGKTIVTTNHGDMFNINTLIKLGVKINYPHPQKKLRHGNKLPKGEGKMISQAEYQKILKGAIQDAGGTEFSSDIAQNFIMDQSIKKRIAKDYPGLSDSGLEQRLQWDLEAQI